MRSWSKVLYVLAGSCALLGCASNSGDSNGAAQKTSMTMAASSCAQQFEMQRQQCEKGCPTATGEEHFSVQHKIAMESSACKERCAEASDKQALTCKAAR